MTNSRYGFTLIELLIVVAIIAILAAIAVPNFLEAQVRAKVSRAKADQRTIATGLESYYIDNNAYPPNDDGPWGGVPVNEGAGNLDPDRAKLLIPLSTPIAYLTSGNTLQDPFGKIYSANYSGQSFLEYVSMDESDFLAKAVIGFVFLTDPVTADIYYQNRWLLSSSGPDRVTNEQAAALAAGRDPIDTQAIDFIETLQNLNNTFPIYDPTNGTVSDGDVMRTGKGIAVPNSFGS